MGKKKAKAGQDAGAVLHDQAGAPVAGDAEVPVASAHEATAAANPQTLRQKRMAVLKARAASLEWDPECLRTFLRDLVTTLEG